jgi:hypothetical protein
MASKSQATKEWGKELQPGFGQAEAPVIPLIPPLANDHRNGTIGKHPSKLSSINDTSSLHPDSTSPEKDPLFGFGEPVVITCTKEAKDEALLLLRSCGLKEKELRLKEVESELRSDGHYEEHINYAIVAIASQFVNLYTGKKKHKNTWIHTQGHLQSGKTGAQKAFLKAHKMMGLSSDSCIQMVILPPADNSLQRQTVERLGSAVYVLKGSVTSANKQFDGFVCRVRAKPTLTEGDHFSLDGEILNLDHELRLAVCQDECHFSNKNGGKIRREYFSRLNIDPASKPEEWKQPAQTTIASFSATGTDELLHLEKHFYAGCNRAILQIEPGKGYRSMEHLIADGSIMDLSESCLPELKDESFADALLHQHWPKMIALGEKRGNTGTLGIIKEGCTKQIEEAIDKLAKVNSEESVVFVIDARDIFNSLSQLHPSWKKAKEEGKKMHVLWPYFGSNNIATLEKPDDQLPLFMNEDGDGFFKDMFDPDRCKGDYAKIYEALQGENVYHTVFCCGNGGKFAMGVTIHKDPWLWGHGPISDNTTESSATQGLPGRSCGYHDEGQSPLIFTNKKICEQYVDRCKLSKPYKPSEHNDPYRGSTISTRSTSTFRHKTYLKAIPDTSSINFSECKMHMLFGKDKTLNKEEELYSLLEELGFKPEQVHVRNTAYKDNKSYYAEGQNINEFHDALQKGFQSNYATNPQSMGYRYAGFVWDLEKLKNGLPSSKWQEVEKLIRQELSLGGGDSLPKYVLSYCDTQEKRVSSIVSKAIPKSRNNEKKRSMHYQPEE